MEIDKPNQSKGHFLRFLKYVKPYWKYVLLASLGGIVKFTVPLAVPQVTRHLLNNVLLNTNLISAEKTRLLYIWTGGLAVLFIFIWMPWTYIRHYYVNRAGHSAVFDLRCELYRHILRMSTSFFDKNKTGSILSRLTSDVALAQNLVGSALTNIWMDAAAVFFVLFFMFRIDAKTTFVALATVPVYLFLFKKFRGRLKSTTRKVQDETAVMSGNAQEKLSGSQVVHAFAQEDYEDRRFLVDSDRLYDISMERARWQSMSSTFIGVITSLAPIIVMLYSAQRVITGSLKIGDLIAINMYLAPLYLPLQRFSELNVVFANAMSALNRIFEFMDQQPDIQNLPNPISADLIEGNVEFRNVWFSYGNGRGDILKGISCAVTAGKNVALVGPSGSGKSTLVSLIPRFYDTTLGEILIDGTDIKKFEVRSLRRKIGIVLQEPILFSGTIKENILYSKADATEEEIIRASEGADAMEFIKNLPEGFDSEVGERGVLLSVGQKQRITIARAFLADPKILILDEATSSLDSESEKQIQTALQRLIRGRTTFTIAHRLSTVIHADLIIVLFDGRIIDSGSHIELLNKSRIYRDLYEHQFLDTSNSKKEIIQ